MRERYFAVLAQHPEAAQHGFARLVVSATSARAAVSRARALRYAAIGAKPLGRRP